MPKAKTHTRLYFDATRTHCKHGHTWTIENTYVVGKSRACRECNNTQQNKRAIMLKHHYLRYGLTEHDVQALFEQQRGLCACCGNPETAIVQRTGKIKMLHVDHDHKTGKVRGLLCQDCNMSLGHLQDSSQRIQMLLDYAKAHGL